MYNDFTIVGPTSDPAGIQGNKDVYQAMRKIVESNAKFISRGGDSGTDQMEKRLLETDWSAAARIAAGDHQEL